MFINGHRPVPERKLHRMRLTNFSDYALRVLMYVGLRGPEELASIHEIATAYDISTHHLTKVVQRLGRAGFVETVRGRKGGLRLARPPGEIVIGMVIRWTEEDLALVGCFADSRSCALAGVCGLQPVLRAALGAFLAVLDGATLADLIHPKRQAMAWRLGLPEPGGARAS